MSEKTFELVILDCDGVLVDSELLGNRVFADMLADHGHTVSAEALRDRFRGMKLGDCLDIVAREAGIRFPATIEADLRQRMSSAFRAELRPVEGALKLVESLRVPFCVASSGPRQKIEENLKTTRLYTHFEGRVFSAYEVGFWKPDPGLFLAAARHFDVAPRRCIVIEDSPVGVTAGLAANMTVLALDETLNRTPATDACRTFPSLDEIRAFLVSQGVARKQ